MALATKIKTLEAATGGGGGGGGPCDECGWGHPDTTYEIVFTDPAEVPPEPEYCQTCGREIGGVIRFADEVGR